MAEFRTEITLKQQDKQINIDSKVLAIGSCFADNIGGKISEYKFNSLINPFGVLYNPKSIANNLQATLDKYIYNENDLIKNNEFWYSIYHHSKYSDDNKSKLLNKINRLSEQVLNVLQKADYIIITFGTVWVYKQVSDKRVVANCHKLPAKQFNRYSLSVNEIISDYNLLINRLKGVNENVNVIFTVSPVRHLKDGFVQNQQSKATLLLAIKEIVEQNNQTFYFPAYEIMMDDLRDYRFYNDDMTHPSELAVEYIWGKFKNTWISCKAQNIMGEIYKINKAVSHRPFKPQAKEYQQFVLNNISKIDNIKQICPELKFEKELDFLRKQLI